MMNERLKYLQNTPVDKVILDNRKAVEDAVKSSYLADCPFCKKKHNVLKLVQPALPDKYYCKIAREYFPVPLAFSELPIREMEYQADEVRKEVEFLKDIQTEREKIKAKEKELEEKIRIINRERAKQLVSTCSHRVPKSKSELQKIADMLNSELKDVKLNTYEEYKIMPVKRGPSRFALIMADIALVVVILVLIFTIVLP